MGNSSTLSSTNAASTDGILTAERLLQSLGARPFRFEAQTGSTNDLARQWAQEGGPHGAVVVTEEQTAGRGRFGRAWNAPPGTGLLMSVILRPRVHQEHVPRLTIVGAVAVADVLGEMTPGKVRLKWPNDVLLNNCKVAGILAEAIWQGDRLNAAVLGIGLNVRVSFEGTPLANHAISIETVGTSTGQPLDRAVLLAKLLRRIDHWAMRVEDPTLLAAWHERLETIGRRVTASTIDGQRMIQGQATGVDSDGALLLKTDTGTMHRVIAGEVTLDEQG
jgi:BirA family biotin operon repressor/biotin-[acetyl-CoA-carboxylase] ligase